MSGAAGESPWLWIAIPAAAVPTYLIDRSRSRKTGRPMQRVGGIYFAPWYWQAIVFAIMGSGTLYQAATSHDRWWWLLSVAAWFGFAWVVVRREPE